MNHHRLHKISATLIGCLLALGGCVGEEKPTPVPLNPVPGQTQIRTMHLSPDAPNVDVYVDQSVNPAFADLAFTEGSEYAVLDTGTYSFNVTPAGMPDNVVLPIEDVELGDAMSYTAVAFDRIAGVQGLLLVDDLQELPEELVRIRAVHVAAGVGEVDIWNLPADGEPVLLYENVQFGQGGDALDVPSGAHVFGIDVDDDAEPDLIFELPDFSAGTYVNLYAVTEADGTPFVLAQLPGGITARVDAEDVTPGPADGNAHVRVLHGSPDAPPVDVFVNDTVEPAFADFPFGTGTEYAELPEGNYRFRVSVTGTGPDAAVIDAADVTLGNQRSYTIVAYDRVEEIDALILEDDYLDLAPNNIRIRAIHTGAGVGDVDVLTLGADGSINLIYDDVAFGTAGEYLDLPAGSYTIGFDVDDDGLVDALFEIPSLTAGTVANVFALTEADGTLFLLAQLRDGNTLRIDAIEDNRETGDVRALHLAPGAPAVDAFLNGADTPVIADLPFGSGTGFLSIPSGLYDVDISATGTSAEESVLSADDFGIEADGNYTLVAYDELADIKLLALEDDLSNPGADTIRVRAIHTGSGVGPVDVLNVPAHGLPGIVYDDLEFGNAGDYVELPAGAYVLGLDLNNDRVPEALFRLPHLPGGTVANVFAVAEPEAVYLVAQLNDGTIARIDASH